MKLAISLAKKGKRRVWPNPMVGCVIVNHGKIVGKGYHEFFGGPHAEINALNAAGENAQGATLYVTLEPCNHIGKTPPCTEAIMKAGIVRVVAAMRDSNPKMRGKSFKLLRQNAVEVGEGVLAEEARQLNWRRNGLRRTSKSSVTVKWAMSLDGKIATRTGDSKWISSSRSRELAHLLRSEVDAVIVGANTVMRDDPALTSHGRGANPVRVLIDPTLRIPMSRRIFDAAAPTIVFHGQTQENRKTALLRKRGHIAVRLSAKGSNISFQDIVTQLNDFSISTILIEGGGETIAAALEAGVVTDVLAFVGPKIIGGKTAISPVEGKGSREVGKALRLTGMTVMTLGSNVVLHGKVIPARGKGNG